MMSELTRLHSEAERLLTVYFEHKDCNDEALRRKVHIDLDMFLMQHRETAMILMTEGLQLEIDNLIAERKSAEIKAKPWRRWLRRPASGGAAATKGDISKDVQQDTKNTRGLES